MSQSTVSYLWREPQAARGFQTGVSLHSHTSQSRETLDFIADFTNDFPILKKLMAQVEVHCLNVTGVKPNYTGSFWTPPLTPRLAFDLESKQIEDQLNLPGLVSISDHDDIAAPMMLRALPSARHIPVSVEWSVPYSNPSAIPNARTDRKTAFHLGIHNLPSATGAEWMKRLNAFTALPVADRPPTLLTNLLAELDAIPGVLIIFNHPLWDLYRIGQANHAVLANEFLAVNGQFVHALELNGLRHWAENRKVQTLALQWNQLVISGGDRHGVEPNANLNLTHATTFGEFVHEVRRERISNVVFMPQYAEPWKHRILQSTLDAVRNYPHFPEGSRRWDERVFHPDTSGTLRPLSQLWPNSEPDGHGGRIDGTAPIWLRSLLGTVRMMGRAPVSGGLRLAWNDASQMRAALAEQDA